MIEQKRINQFLAGKLKQVTGCEVVKANLANAPIPSYPYLSFSILDTKTRAGTYSDRETRYMPLTQVWSLTVQSDDDDEALDRAMRARDWLEEAGHLVLKDNGIVVQSVGPIHNRDSFLTVGYEYRKGFDLVLSFMNVVQVETEPIEKANIKRE